jgi:UDP-glucose 4-epimerase
MVGNGLMLNILITGIAGQLGNRLSKILTEKDIEHRGIDRDSNYKTDVPYLCKDLLEVSNKELSEFIKPVTHIIHFADVINDSKDFENDLEKQFKNCCIGTIKLLNCLHSNIEHFSFASSYSVYGIPKELPLTEKTIPSPQNIYSFSKLSTEKYLTLFGEQNNLPISILRISSVYGPGTKKKNYNRAVPIMIESVLDNKSPYICGEGKTFRDYIYIDDCINATMVSTLLQANGIFNIASGIKTTTKDIVDTIISNSDKDIVVEKKSEKKNEWSAVCDISRMKNKLNYTPKFSIKDGLKLTYEWHRGER